LTIISLLFSFANHFKSGRRTANLNKAPRIWNNPFKKLPDWKVWKNLSAKVPFNCLTFVYSGLNVSFFFANALARAISIASILRILAEIPLTTLPS